MFLDLFSPCFSRTHPFRISSLAIDPQNTSTLYASTRPSPAGAQNGGGVWKSADGGVSWVKFGSPPSGGGFHSLAIDPQNTSTVYSWNGKGLFKSADAGESWSAAIFGPVNVGA